MTCPHSAGSFYSLNTTSSHKSSAKARFELLPEARSGRKGAADEKCRNFPSQFFTDFVPHNDVLLTKTPGGHQAWDDARQEAGASEFTAEMSSRPELRARDLVTISRPRLHQKTRDRYLNICGLCRKFFKKVPKKYRHRFEVNFFRISGIFPAYFYCFLAADTADRKHDNRSCIKPHRCSIQTFETETRK